MKNKFIAILSICIIAFGLIFFLFTNFNIDKEHIGSIEAESYVSLPNYKNIKISKEHTDISDTDIENIIGWDFTASDSFIEELSREIVASGDVILLEAVYYNYELKKEYCEFYYELGSNDAFENDEVFVGQKIGTTLSLDLIMSEEQFLADVKILGIFRYPTLSDEEFILSYYNRKSMQDVVSFIKKRAYNEIVFHHMWKYILENSTITKLPDYIEQKISMTENEYQQAANNENLTLKEYLAKNNIDYKSEIENIHLYYRELLVAQAILEKEKIKIDDKAIHNIALEKCNKLQINIADIYMYYDYDELYYDTLMKALKEVLVPLIQITE